MSAYAAPNLTLTTANAEGAADTVMRTDASVAIFDAVVPGTIEPDDAAGAGAAAVAARRDHQHAIACAAAGTIAPDDAAAEGSASSFSRSDHTHGITCDTAGSIAPDDSAAEGVASYFARSDHTHGITCAAAGTITPDDAAAEGSASSFARSDHTHQITCAAPTTDLSDSTTNSEGSASTFARSDHTHAISGIDYGDEFITSPLSPAELTGNVNNYNPGDDTFVRLSADADGREITGWNAGSSGQWKIVYNNSSVGRNIIFNNADASSTDVNRFSLASGADVEVPPKGSIWFIYHASRWRQVLQPALA